MNDAQFHADVCQSQGIERIAYDANSQLTELHIRAAKRVYNVALSGRLPDVKKVHLTLMASSLHHSGNFRYDPVYLVDKNDKDPEDGRSTPHSKYLDVLMSEWESLCNSYIHTIGDTDDECDKEYACVILYFHFLCIHPFDDGNGRAGRLMYNALRLLSGLPWHTLTTDIHPVYVARLRKYEDEVFRPKYSDMYVKESVKN